MAVAESLKHNTTLQPLTIDCYHMGDEAGIAVAFTRKKPSDLKSNLRDYVAIWVGRPDHERGEQRLAQCVRKPHRGQRNGTRL